MSNFLLAPESASQFRVNSDCGPKLLFSKLHQGVYSMWVCVYFFVCVCVGVFCQMTNVQFENVKEFCVDMLFENLLRLALHCQFTTAARHCCHTLAPLQPQSPSMAHATATFVAALSLATRVPKRSSLRVGEALAAVPLVTAALLLLLSPIRCHCRPPDWKGLST